MKVPPIILVSPGPIDTPTGGYRYDRWLWQGLQQEFEDVRLVELPPVFPHPDADDLDTSLNRLNRLPQNKILIIDGLAAPFLEDYFREKPAQTHTIIIVHLPLHKGPDINSDTAAAWYDLEFNVYPLADTVIATGPGTMEILADLGVPSHKCILIPPGITNEFAPREYPLLPRNLVCVANLVPNKGIDLLIGALHNISLLDWHMTLVGGDELDPDHASAVKDQIRELKLESRITLTGVLEEKNIWEIYRQSDLFVSASKFETYGMSMAEAVASGVPLLVSDQCKNTGAIPLPVSHFFANGDVNQLTFELERLLTQPREYKNLVDGFKEKPKNHRSWGRVTNDFRTIIEKFTGEDPKPE